MRACVEKLRAGQECRRADIPEVEHDERGGAMSGSGRIVEHVVGVGRGIVGAPTILFLESEVESASAPDQAGFSGVRTRAHAGRSKARGRRRLKNVGAPTICFLECGAARSFGTGRKSAGAMEGLTPEGVSYSAGTQKCRRADNSKNWKFTPGVVA